MNIFTHAPARRVIVGLLGSLLLAVALSGRSAAQSATPAPTATHAPRPVDERFGVIESFEDPAAAGRLGVAWTRGRFQWADVQPKGPDDWRPPLDDDALAVELAAGREVVGLIIGIPDWARDRRGLPRGLSLPPDDPDNTWAVFVAELVSRYAGRIDRWIIWNEPDIADRDAPGHTWDGTIDEFFQLQRTAYLAAKATNPEAIVHLGAFTFFWDPSYFARFLDVVAADPEAPAHDYYFDVATAHLYFQPNGIYNILHAFQRVMAARGLDKPIWLVETNAPPMDDPYWEVSNWTLAVSLNEQAAFMPQAIAASLAAGAERVAVYKLKDTEGDRAANPEPFGLVRWDNSRRPAFDTYRVAIRIMAGTTAAERERWDAVAQIRLDQEGQTTTVLFARLPEPQQVRVPATSDSAELVDMWGKRETVEARGGNFNIQLPGALCRQTIADYCMIGGTTYYLVQEKPAVPARDVAAGRNETGEETEQPITTTRAPVRFTPTAGPTKTPTPAASPTATPSPSPAFTLTATPVPEREEPTAAMAAVATMPAATPRLPDVAEATGGARVVWWSDYVGLVVLGAAVTLGLSLAGWLYRRGSLK